MNQLLFSLILRLEGASNVKVPADFVKSLAQQGLAPEQVNKLLWQYKTWTFINDMEDYCVSCGGHLGIHQKPGTKTCSPRCHKLAKRHEIPPFLEIKKEAQERLALLHQMASYDGKIELDVYPWHRIVDGWSYALHDR